MFSKFLGIAEQLSEDFLIRQVHAKSRAIEALMAEFTAILLNQLPVAFECLVFVRFSVKLIHDLDTYSVHSAAHVLDDVKAIKENFSVRE